MKKKRSNLETQAIWYRPVVIKLDDEYYTYEPYMFEPALFILARRPYETVIDEDFQQITARYLYKLLIDLWVVKLKFQWKGREHAKAKALRKREASERMDNRKAYGHRQTDR